MNRARAATGLAFALLGAALAPAQDAAPWPERYGAAPEELVPFRKEKPHHRWFTEPQAFLGAGRDEPAAEGLRALRVGVLLPGRGTGPGTPDGERGVRARRGIDLALADADAARREGELPFELVAREDQPVWGGAASTMAALSWDDEVLAVLGSVDGAATHVALRVALKAEVFMVTTASSDPTLTETNIPWILRTFPDDRQHGYRLARRIVEERKLGRVAVVRVNDRYGRMGVRVLLDSLRRLGHPVVLEIRFAPGERSFETPVERVRGVGPDAVVLWGDSRDVGRAARALRAGGVEAPFFGPDRLVDPSFLEAAGPAAEGTEATYPFDPGRADPAWVSFRKRYREAHGEEPDAIAACSYDGAALLFRAIRKVGPNRARIRDELAALRSWSGVAGPLVFDATSNNLAPLRLGKVVDGAFRFE